jgi:hypothetical protein
MVKSARIPRRKRKAAEGPEDNRTHNVRVIPGGFTGPDHTARRIPIEPGEAQLRCRYRERRTYDG